MPHGNKKVQQQKEGKQQNEGEREKGRERLGFTVISKITSCISITKVSMSTLMTRMSEG